MSQPARGTSRCRRRRGRRAARPRARRAVTALSRTRLKALILDGAVTIGARTIRDPGYRVNAGETVAVDGAAARAGRAGGRGHPAQHRLRGRRDHRHRQAGRPGGASGRRPRHRHAGQRADRPLRRQPVRHRRGEAAGHRAPARQGHHRADGGGQDRPRAPGAGRAVRRSRPHRAAASAAISPSSGARPARPKGTIDAPIDRHPHAAATRWRSRQGGREAITHWQVLERYHGQGRQAGRRA